MSGRVGARGSNLSRADWMLRRLAESGERLTGPRETVVRAPAARQGVISPEALSYELHPEGVGRATVYRTLHLLCSACNTVIAVDATGVESEIQRLADQLKFRVDTHTLEFAGLCESCQQAN